MRRVIYIIFSLAAFSIMGACDAEDMMDVEPAGMSLVDEVFFNVVTPFNRVVEIADFYCRYKDNRENDDFVDALKTEYFGDAVSLSEFGNGGVDVEWWGTAELGEEDGDAYIVTLDSHWMGIALKYYVSVTASRSYRITYDSDGNDLLTSEKGYGLALLADVHISGRYACADVFRFLYEDKVEGVDVRVNAGEGDEMVVFDLCRDGAFMYYPVSGTFYWSTAGNVLNNVKIVFYGDYFEVIETEDIGVDVENLL